MKTASKVFMRKFFFTAIFLLLLYSCAYGDAALYRGTRSIGAVPTFEDKSRLYVPADDVGKLLGFTARNNGEEVQLVRGNVSLRVIANSAAAWRGSLLVPLQSPAVSRSGRVWVDSQSAVTLFQSSAGAGAGNRLRFSKIASSASPTTARLAESPRSNVEFGSFALPEERTPEPEQSVTPTPEPKPAVAVKPDTKPAPVVRSTPKKSGKAQPKHETFKPDDEQKGSVHSGTIQSIRWTEQEGRQKKIRAVIVADDEADPEVFMSGGKLHALFSSSLEDGESLASPYPNIKTELVDGQEMVFTPEGITRADKTVLSSPRRIVFDFFFPEETEIAATTPQPEAPETQPIIAQTPEQKKPEAPEPEPEQKPEKKEEPVKRADPIIIVNNTPRETSPAVKTPPSAITIPAAKTDGRKIIVVDAGHGGKDPGASANGVVEKNVNLGIALELERVLTAQGFRVVMTRKTDVYLTLQERTDIANRVDADLFVSVHVNALPSKTSMTGFEIYIMALPTDKDAMELAKIENREYVEGKGYDVENVDRRTEMLLRILGDMQQNNKISESTDFAAALYNAGARSGLPMRRVAQAPFFVLRGAGMPAVLIETGFVTNPAESSRLATPEYQLHIARAMADGISRYIQ